MISEATSTSYIRSATPIADMVKTMLSGGIQPDIIVLAVRTAELVSAQHQSDSKRAEPPLSNAERSKRWRDRNATQRNATQRHATSRNVTEQPIVVEQPPTTNACAPPERHEICAEERKKEKKEVVVLEVAREPDEKSPAIGERAWAIAREIATLCGQGDPRDWPPAWCGCARTVQGWLNEKVEPGLMLAVARNELRKKRDGPVYSINYFAKPIARAHERSKQTQMPLMSLVGGSYAESGGRDEFSRPRPGRRGFAARLADSMRRQANAAG